MKSNAESLKLRTKTKWVLIILYAIMIIPMSFLLPLEMKKNIQPFFVILTLFPIAWLHGTERYGTKNMIFFFVLTWVVGNGFETLSIKTGFPFGHYFYDRLQGPRIGGVPVLIMPAYFAMGYFSWVLSHILTGQFARKLSGFQIFTVPFIASFIMVMWDLCMDPVNVYTRFLWVWRDGGSYFGVPMSNFAGWFFVVYCFLQIFALYISRRDNNLVDASQLTSANIYWIEAVAAYGIQGLLHIVNPFTFTTQLELHNSMALITVFTMVFVSLLALVIINNNSERYW